MAGDLSLTLTPTTLPSSTDPSGKIVGMNHSWVNSTNIGEEEKTLTITFKPGLALWQTVEIMLYVTTANAAAPGNKFDGAVYNGTPGNEGKTNSSVTWTTELKTSGTAPTKSVLAKYTDFTVIVLWTKKGDTVITTTYKDPDPRMIVKP